MGNEEEKNDHIVTPALKSISSAFPGSPPITESTEPPSITLTCGNLDELY